MPIYLLIYYKISFVSRAAFERCLVELNEAGVASISTFLNKDGGLDLTSNSGIKSTRVADMLKGGG